MELYNKLIELSKENITSFHVPGHKYTKLYKKYFDKIENILSIDLTEIPGTDDLHSPEECILESQKKASKFYSTEETLFLVNGTTCGIYAMIMASTSPGDKIIVQRDCHRAVFDAIMLGDLEAVYVLPYVDKDTNLAFGIKEENLKRCISDNSDAKAVVLTYPNYNGICCDIKKIEKVVHTNNMLLLVDEAHGAHLVLNKKLPISSIEAGADIVVQSSHKTLPVFTQSSMLHLNSNRINKKKLKEMLKLYQTSSPSYILMSSLDIGLSIMSDVGYDYMDDLINNIKKFQEKTYDLGYKFLEKKYVEKEGFFLDTTKMTLLGKQSNVDPICFEKYLRKNNLQIEFSNKNFALFVSSFCNEEVDFIKLLNLMEKANLKCYSGIDSFFYSNTVKRKITIREAYYSKKNMMLLKDAVGFISADFIIPYPPGVPILIPGEEISKEIINVVKNLVLSRQKLVGIYDEYVDFESLYIEVVFK